MIDTEKQYISTQHALLFMRAVGYQPVHCVKVRRGKIYDMWADKPTHRKIISRAQLEKMSVGEFVVWLRSRSQRARVLFPDPRVYSERWLYD
jgi:hypothetical protein